MDPVVKAQRQLESIAGQIAQLEAKAGADEEARLKLSHLQHQIAFLREQIRAHVNAWHKTELARHSQRPFTQDYIDRLFNDWSEVHADRSCGDAPAIICDIARYHGDECMALCQQKGHVTKQLF